MGLLMKLLRRKNNGTGTVIGAVLFLFHWDAELREGGVPCTRYILLNLYQVHHWKGAIIQEEYGKMIHEFLVIEVF